MSKKRKSNRTAVGGSGTTTAVESSTTHPSGEPGALQALATRLGPSFFAGFVPALLAVFSSINTLWDGFAADDTQQILNNALIRDLTNIPLAFTNSVWSFTTTDIVFSVDSYYRPLFNVILTFNYAIWHENAWGWHLMNILIHTGVTVLVFRVLLELTSRQRLSCASACLFAVHPVHVESVAWISGITDPSMALLVLPAFLCYLKYRKTGRRYYLGITVAAFFLALFLKETAVALPLIIAYCEVFHFSERAGFGERVRAAVFLGLLFVLPTVVYFLLRYNALGSALLSAEARYPAGPALLTIPLALLKYLKLLCVPWGYSYQHLTFFVQKIASIEFLAPTAVLLALVALIAVKGSRLLKLAAVWFILWLAPALGALRQFDPEFLVQERYLYMSSIGFCLSVAMGIEWLCSRRVLASASQEWTRDRAGLVLVAVLVLVWGSVSVVQNRVWANTVTLFKNCVDRDPTSARAHSTLASNYFLVGNPRDAEIHARKAIELDPKYPGGYANLSYFSKQYGKLDQAIDYLEQAVSAVEPGPMTKQAVANAYLNLGLLYAERKDVTLAEENLRRSVEIWPRAVGWYYLGLFYFNQGRFDDAEPSYHQAMDMVPARYAPIHLSMAAVYEKQGKLDQARVEYQKYLQLALPNAPDRSEVQKHLTDLFPELKRK